ncbi:MFS transporter [Peribacillus glennii]|uniref:hypothetical protein n=1 Tax=Peribacillus glennii TaxID=2303991 RepID=UPI002D769964|nr:hypothetical protein [Peribacillus glennii]
MRNIALALSGLIGVAGQLKNIPLQRVVQNSVPKEKLTTVHTSLGAIGTGTYGIAVLIMGGLADLYGVRIAFLIAGCTLFFASSIAYKGKQLFVKGAENSLKL